MSNKKYTLDDFYFNLPDNLIAQYPAEKRDESRLLVLDRNNSTYQHKIFYQIDEFIKDGDVLIFNNAKVISARLHFKRKTGAIIEVFLTQKISDKIWHIICNRTKRLKKDEIIVSVKNEAIVFNVIEKIDDYIVVESNIDLTDDVLLSIGQIPLPPYIKREFSDIDRTRYQTVYASESGAVASPTAGLHFTDTLLKKIEKKGVEILFLTLYVSWGTFQPVRVQELEKHIMHKEKYFISDETCERINSARKNNKRIIAVGTTSLRVIESTYKNGLNIPGSGETDLFIYPPYKIESIDALITNFHTPYSTLLMLVSAFAGYDTIMNAYKEAVKEKYRFFSYGDAMMII